ASGTGCTIKEGTVYYHHPCARLFACDACLTQMIKAGAERDDLSLKGEIFVDAPGIATNDDNPNLIEMRQRLGFPNHSCAETYGEPNEVCGHHIWISGFVAIDGSHDNRPEIHPIQEMIIDQGVHEG